MLRVKCCLKPLLNINYEALINVVEEKGPILHHLRKMCSGYQASIDKVVPNFHVRLKRFRHKGSSHTSNHNPSHCFAVELLADLIHMSRII